MANVVTVKNGSKSVIIHETSKDLRVSGRKTIYPSAYKAARAACVATGIVEFVRPDRVIALVVRMMK